MSSPAPGPNRPVDAGSPPPSTVRSRGRAPLVAGIVAATLLVGGLSLASLQRDLTPPADTSGTGTASAPAAPSTTAGDPGATDPAAPGDVAELIASMQRREKDDPYALGRVDAPVVLIEFSDWRCPFCALWARTTKPELQKYIDDGTLRIEYRDLPIFGEESVLAARAGRAAGMQGRFWQFYDAVTAAAPENGHPDLPAEKLMEFAQQAGVPDLKKFGDDMTSDAPIEMLRRDAEDARRLGAPNSVPLFLIGNEAVSGAQPTEVFVDAIERQADDARR